MLFAMLTGDLVYSFLLDYAAFIKSMYFSIFPNNELPSGIFVVKVDFDIRLHTSIIDGRCIWTGEELAGDTSQNASVW